MSHNYWEAAEDVIDVVRELNIMGIVHSDWQPRNILVVEMGSGAFKPYLNDCTECIMCL